MSFTQCTVAWRTCTCTVRMMARRTSVSMRCDPRSDYDPMMPQAAATGELTPSASQRPPQQNRRTPSSACLGETEAQKLTRVDRLPYMSLPSM